MFEEMFDENKNLYLDKVGNKVLLEKYGIALDRSDLDKMNEPPKAMKDIWNWQHKGYVDDYAQFKTKLDSLKKLM